MSEEEKNAIDELKSMREYFEFQPEGCNWRLSFNEEEVHTIIDVIINLIDKQKEEIEIWKETENDYEHELARKDEKIEKQQKEIERLKNDKKKALNYINQEMYVDTNPTICEMEDEENTIIELPISLNLYNEDLRKLFDLLEEE